MSRIPYNELEAQSTAMLKSIHTAMKSQVDKEDKGVKLKKASEGKASDASDVMKDRDYINKVIDILWERGESKVKYRKFGIKA